MPMLREAIKKHLVFKRIRLEPDDDGFEIELLYEGGFHSGAMHISSYDLVEMSPILSAANKAGHTQLQVWLLQNQETFYTNYIQSSDPQNICLSLLDKLKTFNPCRGG